MKKSYCWNAKRISSLLKFETTKLFYDKYVYKLVVRNQLAHIFRDKNYAWAKENLDILQQNFESGVDPIILHRGLRHESVPVVELQQAQKMFNEFSNFQDMKLRVENPRIQIYSNNLSWMNKLKSKLLHCCEFWEPSTEGINLLEANTIISDTIKDFQYKVTLGKQTNSEFTNWVDSNTDKIKIGRVTYNEIKNNGYTKGLYFYVRDEKILNLVNLIIGGSPQRTDKIVYRKKTDK
jgi:hypothetical protein